MNTKVPILRLLLLICLVLGGSCTVSKRSVSEKGVRSVVDYQGERYKGELIAVHNDSLIVAEDGSLYRIHLNDVGKLVINGYRNPGRTISIIVMSAAYGYMGVALLVTNPVIGSAVVLATIGASTALFMHNPYKYTAPLNDEYLKQQIRVHCRYPEGLTPEQLQILLDHHGQLQFLEYQ